MSEEKQNLKEQKQLKAFLNSSIGRWWWLDNKILKIPSKNIRPDFVFDTNNHLKIGLEITEFFANTKNKGATQSLTNIGNKACEYFRKKYNIRISILIDWCDPRKWSPNLRDHINSLYNPGISKITCGKNLLKMIQDKLDTYVVSLKKGKFLQIPIHVENNDFKVSVEAAPWNLSHEYECRVNNPGLCAQNPFEELQACIENKNKKIDAYLSFCNKCYLLVVIPTPKDGNFCILNEKELQTITFKSKFKAIFVYDEFNKKVINLKTC